MKHETKFDLGQEVFCITDGYVSRLVLCRVCDADGKVEIGGEQFVCPKCAGKSRHPVRVSKWMVANSGVVGKVQSVAYAPGEDARDRWDAGNTYMLDSTGIGSGQTWKEDHLFASRHEAQQRCDELNANRTYEDEATK